VEGNWTSAFAKALGCDFVKKGSGDKGKLKEQTIDVGKSKDAVTMEMPLNRYLPRVMIDGPFGSASEDFNKFETVLLVGGESALYLGTYGDADIALIPSWYWGHTLCLDSEIDLVSNERLWAWGEDAIEQSLLYLGDSRLWVGRMVSQSARGHRS
jgi:hypothetical protein